MSWILVEGERRRGKMVQQAGAEFATGNLDEYTRYFNYLRTLADLTAMASIVAVQVIGRFEEILLDLFGEKLFDPISR